MDFAAWFERGLTYEAFLSRYADEEQRRRWSVLHSQVTLTVGQKELLRGFRRLMKVLVVAGTWCGDCVNQCPILARFAAENELLQIRFFDRDVSADLARELSICGAPRVPSVLFLSEDNFACGRYGDRTLSKYRQVAAEGFGPACPTGIVPPAREILDSVIQDWLNEFERIQLMLLTSGRLRTLHGD